MTDQREAIIEAARVLEHVEAVLSIVQPRSHTQEYIQTLEEVRGTLARLGEVEVECLP